MKATLPMKTSCSPDRRPIRDLEVRGPIEVCHPSFVMPGTYYTIHDRGSRPIERNNKDGVCSGGGSYRDRLGRGPIEAKACLNSQAAFPGIYPVDRDGRGPI